MEITTTHCASRYIDNIRNNFNTLEFFVASSVELAMTSIMSTPLLTFRSYGLQLGGLVKYCTVSA